MRCESPTYTAQSHQGGTFSYIVNGFSGYGVQENLAVPEFSDIALITGLLVTIAGLIVLRKNT